jgi:hypothetical protein
MTDKDRLGRTRKEKGWNTTGRRKEGTRKVRIWKIKVKDLEQE